MTEAQLREQIAVLGESMFRRGLTFGSSGNISVRTDDGWLMTPTNSRLGSLDPARLSKISLDGHHVSGDSPTKEAFLHTAFYRQRPSTRAVVHLHAVNSVAVSCMAGLDTTNVLPPITPYYVMRIGKLPLVPYFPPGDRDLADAVSSFATNHHAILLANHGPVVAGKSLAEAANAVEELEETAKLFLMLQNHKTRFLTPEQVEELERRFGR